MRRGHFERRRGQESRENYADDDTCSGVHGR